MNKTGLIPRQLKNWFQNHRMKHKREGKPDQNLLIPGML